MSQSPEFKQYLISDLEWLVMPPILLRQFRIFYHEARPIAAVIYARVSKDVEDRFKQEGMRGLRASDWKSGSQPLITSIIAPFGGDGLDTETLRAINRPG